LLYRLRGVDPIEAIQSMAGSRQVLGLRAGQSAAFTRRFVGLEMRTPADPSEFLGQLSYVGPMARAAGFGPTDILNVAAFTAELQGRGTRGGLSPQAESMFFQSIAGGGSPAASAALEALGVLTRQDALRPELRGNFGAMSLDLIAPAWIRCKSGTDTGP
jgi:hypothetical protein